MVTGENTERCSYQQSKRLTKIELFRSQVLGQSKTFCSFLIVDSLSLVSQSRNQNTKRRQHQLEYFEKCLSADQHDRTHVCWTPQTSPNAFLTGKDDVQIVISNGAWKNQGRHYRRNPAMPLQIATSYNKADSKERKAEFTNDAKITREKEALMDVFVMRWRAIGIVLKDTKKETATMVTELTSNTVK